MNRHVIIGAGTAGRRAASVIRERDPDAEVIVVEQETALFYYRPMLGEMIARDLLHEQISTKADDKLSKLGIKPLKGIKVVSIDLKNQELGFDNGECLSFDKLLIASGRKTARLSLDDGTVPGISYLDTLDDATMISSALKSTNKKALIYGGSLQALNAIRGLRGRDVDCTLILSEDRFWPGVLDPTASQIVEDRLHQEGVTLLKQDSIGELIVEDSVLKGLITQKGEKISADLLVVAVPQIPATDFLEDQEITTMAGVLVNTNLRTKHPNIYAAGDVAILPSVHTGIVGPQPGWVSAWKQGYIAGQNMLGESSEYLGIPSLRTKFLDLDIVCLGLSDPNEEGIQENSGEYPFEELPSIYKKIVYKNARTTGAIFTGDVSEAGAVEGWIRKGLKKNECDSRILDQMFLPFLREIVAIGTLCPVCKFEIQVDDQLEEGSVVTCPACGVDFRLHRMPNGVFRSEVIGF